ncbi:MAG: NAD+ kinase [Phycisphaerales bacterium]|nr:NAD+ kinase [Phycisphaerales bacterium]MCB9862741.1 NAD+ kinase [Phycisphaerales bacterium]
MNKAQPNIVVVTKETRLKDLKVRFGTPDMARFKLEQLHIHDADRRQAAGEATAANSVATIAGFREYESEARAYDRCVREVRSEADVGFPVKLLDRKMLPTFDFWNTVAVIVVGPDGLVANTAKYVGEIPIIGVNPDPTRIDGVLLPFHASNVRSALQRTLNGKYRSESVSLACARLHDGQSLLAFNDLFIGAKTHVSARYTITQGSCSESQSSSGVIVATGGGATGWLSSMFNMAEGIARHSECKPPARPTLRRGDHRLIWVVREPFRSRQTSADMVVGEINQDQMLVIESLMPQNGVIFSDGIEADYLEFNSGCIARISIAEQRATLVVR